MNSSKDSITLLKFMTIAKFKVMSDKFWAQSYKGKRIIMTRLYKKAESKEQKLERDYAVAKEDAFRSEKQ